MVEETSLRRLNPQTDSKGILRVSGRTSKNAWNKSVIVPKSSHISTLITRYFHSKIYRLGYRNTLGAICENGFWLVSGPAKVKSTLENCVGCKRLREPEERLQRTAPFITIGMDVFGPFLVRDRCSEVK